MDFSTYKKMISVKSSYARIRTHASPGGAHQIITLGGSSGNIDSLYLVTKKDS